MRWRNGIGLLSQHVIGVGSVGVEAPKVYEVSKQPFLATWDTGNRRSSGANSGFL